MKKVAVVYWSGTGNTESMANEVVLGVTEAGGEVSLLECNQFNSESVKEYDAIAFGCPSMGSEQLEECEFEPMFTSCIPNLKGKSIALFGSYGWGDGQWMQEWEEECVANQMTLVADPVICNEAPGEEAIEACRGLGKDLV